MQLLHRDYKQNYIIMDIFSTFITKNLIDYLNNDDTYYQIECGIFNLTFQRKKDEQIDWNLVKELTNSMKMVEYIQIGDYIDAVTERCIMYESCGLDVTIWVDLMRIAQLENIRLCNNNIFCLTDKIIDKLSITNECLHDFKIITCDITKVRMETCTITDLKNILSTLFTDDGRLTKEQKRAIDFEPKIVVDQNLNVLDGKFRILVLHLLDITTIKCYQITCITDKIKFIPKCECSFAILLELENYIKQNPIIYKGIVKFANKCNIPIDTNKEENSLLIRTVLDKWLNKIPINN